ncbi:Addiction module toxin, RelE/StbE [Candidatus Koribacter versatilis Ellin345]|uniref:Addiction module toxin, RelE/StbE n=1 Tax=Koribacter versatilis (strain Ellin345) TaxID=204669 RepID=Q1IPW0_KORVE|nr:Addiction module toxin, RelE/StbE [Candidatus Koribacter versatilis Ellin345]
MELEWSTFAMADRETIFDYIEAESPQNAVLVDDRIETQIEMLVQFPESGRQGRVEGTRELVVELTPFIVAYRIEVDCVRILRVLNGAQQWPDVMPEDSAT